MTSATIFSVSPADAISPGSFPRQTRREYKWPGRRILFLSGSSFWLAFYFLSLSLSLSFRELLSFCWPFFREWLFPLPLFFLENGRRDPELSCPESRRARLAFGHNKMGSGGDNWAPFKKENKISIGVGKIGARALILHPETHIHNAHKQGAAFFALNLVALIQPGETRKNSCF